MKTTLQRASTVSMRLNELSLLLNFLMCLQNEKFVVSHVAAAADLDARDGGQQTCQRSQR